MHRFRQAVSFIALAFLVLSFHPAQAAEKRITIGTAGESGVYYPVGGTICRYLLRGTMQHGYRCAVEPTGGSIYNLNAIRDGSLDLGFAQSDWQYNAYHGAGVFADAGPNPDLRSLFSLHSEALTIVVGADSGIGSFDQLKGHRVNLGNPGSGMRGTMDEVLKLKGWGTGVFRPATEFQATDQAAKLCSKQIEAFIFATGHPNGSIQEVTSNCQAKLIDIDASIVDRLIEAHPYYAHATIPGGMYQGNPDDIHTFGVKATLVTSRETDEQLVYEIVKGVFDNFDDFKTTHPILSTLTRKGMIENGLTAPLHEGAKRYYREVGLIK